MWKISLSSNPSLSLPFLGVVILLSLSFPVPLMGQILALLNSFLIFSYVVWVSKTYVAEGGDLQRVATAIGEANLIKVVKEHPSVVLGVMVAQLILGVVALILSIVILSLGGVWYVLMPLVSGEGDVNLLGVLLAVLVSLLLYFSLVSSFPIFFGRAILRGKGFGDTLRFFISSLWSELSWKTFFNLDYLVSSAVISAIVLAMILFNLLLMILPFGFFLSPVISFLTLHLAYLFGSVAVFKLLRS